MSNESCEQFINCSLTGVESMDTIQNKTYMQGHTISKLSDNTEAIE